MNKYIKLIESNNIFIIKFLNEFNNLLAEEKNKNKTRFISNLVIKEHYKNKLSNEPDFEKYRISQGNSSGLLFVLTRINRVNQVAEDFFVDRVYFEINKKNNEVRVESITFRNNIEDKISINYSLSVDSKTQSLNLSLVLRCHETANEKKLSIESNDIKMYSFPSQTMPSKNFELNKSYLDSFFAIAKIDMEFLFNYLFLGKNFDKENRDLLSLNHDINLKNNNIFRINLLNNNLNVKKNKKINHNE